MKMSWIRLQASRWASLWIWLVGIALVVGVGAWIGGTLGIASSGTSTRLQVVGVTLAGMTAMIKSGTWLYSRSRGTQARRDVAEALVNAIAKREEASRATLLGGTTFADLSLASGSARSHVVGRPKTTSTLRGLFAGLVRYRSSGDDPIGLMSSIATLFASLNPSRLLILGEPGSGKTVLAMTLILKLLETDQKLIPVRLSIAAWDPENDLDEWLIDRLSLDYGIPLKSARDLVETRPRRILPVLDGLDEMDNDPPGGTSAWAPKRALAALDKLNNYYDGSRDGPVVLTCRKNRYEQICRAGIGLRFAKTVEILPLGADQITEYLDKAMAGMIDSRPNWRLISDHIRAGAGDDLVVALSTPWLLHLVVSFAEADGDPGSLLHAARGGGPEAQARMRALLLDGYVSAVTRLANRRAKFRANIRNYAPAPADVECWMRSLARHLGWQKTYASTARARPPGLSDIDIVPHLLWPIGGWSRVKFAHIIAGFAWSIIMLGAIDRPWGDRYMSAGLIRVSASLENSFDLPSGSRIFISSVLFIFAVGSIGFLASWPCRKIWPAPIQFIRIRRNWSDRLQAIFASGVRGGLAWAIIGATFGGIVMIVESLGGNIPPNLADLLGVVLLALSSLLVGCIVFGSTGAILSALIESLNFDVIEWNGEIGVVSSRSAIRAELRWILVLNVVSTLAVYLPSWWFGADVGGSESPVFSALITFILMFPFSLIVVGRAWVRYVLAIMLAWRRGLLPLRFGRFLDWATEVGLLRASGSAYQFRHLELQHWLYAGRSTVGVRTPGIVHDRDG